MPQSDRRRAAAPTQAGKEIGIGNGHGTSPRTAWRRHQHNRRAATALTAKPVWPPGSSDRRARSCFLLLSQFRESRHHAQEVPDSPRRDFNFDASMGQTVASVTNAPQFVRLLLRQVALPHKQFHNRSGRQHWRRKIRFKRSRGSFEAEQQRGTRIHRRQRRDLHDRLADRRHGHGARTCIRKAGVNHLEPPVSMRIVGDPNVDDRLFRCMAARSTGLGSENWKTLFRSNL